MKYYNDFINRYGIISINVDRKYSRIDYSSGPPTSSLRYGLSSYYDIRDEMLDVEIPRTSFDALVNLEGKYEELAEKERYERWMRKNNPSVRDAYEKYQILLELCR